MSAADRSAAVIVAAAEAAIFAASNALNACPEKPAISRGKPSAIGDAADALALCRLVVTSQRITVDQCVRAIVTHPGAESDADLARGLGALATVTASLRRRTEALAEAERFAAADKIAAADYTGPVFWRGGPASRGLMVGEGFFDDVADLLDACDAEGIEPPEYAWACHRDVPSTDAERLIEDALEGHVETAGDSITSEHQHALEAFLTRWWQESGAGTWRPSYQLAVVLKDGAA